MGLDQLYKKQLTQKEIDERLKTVSHSIADYLENNDIDIDIEYNPNKNTFKSWYGRTFHVNYYAGLGIFNTASGRIHSNQINVNVLIGAKLIPPEILSDGGVANRLLHEKIHQDIGIIETPLAVLGLSTYLILTKNFLGTAGLLLGYLFVRELVVDGIKNLKSKKKSKNQNGKLE